MSGHKKNIFPVPGFNIEEVREHWDNVLEVYDRANEKIGYGHTQRFVHGIKYFQGHSDPKLLNIWSRMGEAVPYLRQRFPSAQIVHLEASAKMIDAARQRFPVEDFRQTDLGNLDFPSDSFDAVLSLETLEHCPDPYRFLCELFRVIRPGGELVLSCPPATAEPMLRIYETFFENHGEGPHKFPQSRLVKKMLTSAGFRLLEHRGTVFLPVIPNSLAWLDRILEKCFGRTPFGEFGIRQFYYCVKPEMDDG